MKKIKFISVAIILIVVILGMWQIHNYSLYKACNIPANTGTLRNISVFADEEKMLIEQKDEDGNLFTVKYLTKDAQVQYVIVQVIRKEIWTFSKGKIIVGYKPERFQLVEFNNTDYKIGSGEVSVNKEYANPALANNGYVGWFESSSWINSQINATEIKLVPKENMSGEQLEDEEFNLWCEEKSNK